MNNEKLEANIGVKVLQVSKFHMCSGSTGVQVLQVFRY